MANLKTKNKQNPKLQQSKLSDGRASLYLEFYLGRTETPVLDEDGNPVYYTSGAMAGKPKYKIKHDRRKENLNLYIWIAPRTQQERLQNKNTLALAEKIRFEREQQLLEDREGYRLKKERIANFHSFFEEYIENYTKADKRMIKLAHRRFRAFLQETPGYAMYDKIIRPQQLTKEMMIAFVEYLQAHGKGEGPQSIYQRFKKVLNYAVEKDILPKSPCDGITIRIDEKTLKKEVLSLDEIKRLMATHYTNENPVIQRAFLFSLFCGLRWCDVNTITFRNIDYANKLLIFEQNKTKGHSSASGVIIPLNDDILSLVGEPTSTEERDNIIFPLPSHTACLKAVKRWVIRAGIDKHITWHCARHSFGVNLLNGGANIKTVSTLLGHSSLRHTEKYTRANDGLMVQAINSLGAVNYSTAE